MEKSKGAKGLPRHLDLISLSSKAGTPAKRAEQCLGENKAIPPRTVPSSGIAHPALGVSCQGGSRQGEQGLRLIFKDVESGRS